MIETLQKKLQQLLKERENAQIAVLNYNGAVAILEQLINEEQAKQTAQPPEVQEGPRVLRPRSANKTVAVKPEEPIQQLAD